MPMTRAIAFAALLLQTSPPPTPSVLEAFAARTTAQIVWSREVGRIDSDESHAVITALGLDDLADPTAQLSGVRIDLVSGTGSDHIYVEEGQLEAVREAVAEIVAGMDRERNTRTTVRCRYLGAALFWRPDQHVHELSAAFYIVPDSTGLSISAYGSTDFRFPNRSPALLEKAIARAAAALKAR
jgi:hypothetical protein